MSQQYLNSRVISSKAGADLSAKINYFAKQDTSANNQVILADAGALVMGVIQNKPKSGEAASIAIGETVKVIAGGTVSRGDLIVSDANGKAIARTAESNIYGFALEAGVSGDLIEVMVRPLYIA